VRMQISQPLPVGVPSSCSSQGLCLFFFVFTVWPALQSADDRSENENGKRASARRKKALAASGIRRHEREGQRAFRRQSPLLAGVTRE
jgi:hypothetical protein